MGYFNPITYFFKQLIRIFTKKFFWVILICVCIFLGVLIFSPDVNAIDYDYTSETNDIVLNNFYYAKKYINDNIGNFTDYAIIYRPRSYSNGASLGQYCLFAYNSNGLGDVQYLYDNNQGFYYFNTKNVYFTLIYDPYNAVLDGSNICGSIFDSDTDISSIPIKYNGFNNSSYHFSADIMKNSTYTTIYSSFTNGIFASSHHLDLNNIPTYVYKPYFITTNEELQTFDFDYLQISGGTTPYYTSITENSEKHSANFRFRYIYKNVVSEIDVSDYISFNSSTNTWQINIPYNAITNSVMVRNGETFTYGLNYKPFFGTEYYISTGELTYNLTSEQENQINEDNNKQLIDNIAENQKQTNERLDNVDNSINNMSNTLTDSNVDDSSVDDFAALGSDLDTEDVSGIDELFQKLYDAFCTDEVQDLTFTIPFTDKRVTINAANISDRFPEAITSIVGVFVWGMIGLYVLKDIRTTIDKIAEGSPEDVGSDVKKEVL